MDDTRSLVTGRLATSIGAFSIGGAACLTAFSLIGGGPLGTVNDVCNATAGILSGALAWRMAGRSAGGRRTPAVALAVGGAGLTLAGSALVISGTTGWMLAGLVTSLGFAGIGAWLIALSRSDASAAWPSRLRTLGVVAGALMLTGVLAAPGIALRLDEPATAPGWVWLSFLGWLGIYVVYPAWAIWFGRVETREAQRTLAATVAPGGTLHA